MTTTAPWAPPAPSPAPTLPEPAAPLSPLAGSAAEGLLVLVAPANGRFAPEISEGPVDAGGLIAHVAGGRGRREEVRSPVAATVRGLLTRPGQLVLRGQALAWAVVTAGAPA